MSISNNVIELNIKQGYTSPIIGTFSVVQFDSLNSFEFRVMDGFRSIDYRNFERVDLEIVQGNNTPRIIENIRINANSFSYNVQPNDFPETGKTVMRLRMRNYNNLTVTTNAIRFNVIVSDFDTGEVFPNMDNYTTRIDFENHTSDNQKHTTLEEKQLAEQRITENRVNATRNREDIDLIKGELLVVGEDISSNKRKLKDHDERIKTNTSSIEMNENRINSNREDINQNQRNIEENSVSIVQNRNNININRTDIQRLRVDVDRINTNSNVVLLSQRVTSLENRMTTVENRLTALENR